MTIIYNLLKVIYRENMELHHGKKITMAKQRGILQFRVFSFNVFKYEYSYDLCPISLYFPGHH